VSTLFFIVKDRITDVSRQYGIKVYWWIHRIAPAFMPKLFQRIIAVMKRQG
jgi:hypothetical protein